MEIGGYLEYEKNHGKEYHDQCLRFNTARNCLKYLIEARGIKKIWLSRWNCSAVLNACKTSGVEICYFDLDEAFLPVMPSEYRSDDYVYLVNYYGQIKSPKYEHMILDNVQAFFEKPEKGIDTIYTCRKYFGVTDGAYLYTDAVVDREPERDLSHDRIGYLAGRLEEGAAAFYQAYQKNEELLDSLPLKKMSAFTENLLKGIDYEAVRLKREENFRLLHKHLGRFNQWNVRVPVGPFAYPFLVENGKEIRSALQRSQIYIAKLWPNVVNGKESVLADNLLPLPCDQRYTTETMEKITETIMPLMAKGDLS